MQSFSLSNLLEQTSAEVPTVDRGTKLYAFLSFLNRPGADKQHF